MTAWSWVGFVVCMFAAGLFVTAFTAWATSADDDPGPTYRDALAMRDAEPRHGAYHAAVNQAVTFTPWPTPEEAWRGTRSVSPTSCPYCRMSEWRHGRCRSCGAPALDGAVDKDRGHYVDITRMGDTRKVYVRLDE